MHPAGQSRPETPVNGDRRRLFPIPPGPGKVASLAPPGTSTMRLERELVSEASFAVDELIESHEMLTVETKELKLLDAVVIGSARAKGDSGGQAGENASPQHACKTRPDARGLDRLRNAEQLEQIHPQLNSRERPVHYFDRPPDRGWYQAADGQRTRCTGRANVL